MKIALIILIVILAVIILLIKPKVQRMNKKEKKIFRNAMKEIDSN